jgi:hypothetical protein
MANDGTSTYYNILLTYANRNGGSKDNVRWVCDETETPVNPSMIGLNGYVLIAGTAGNLNAAAGSGGTLIGLAGYVMMEGLSGIFTRTDVSNLEGTSGYITIAGEAGSMTFPGGIITVSSGYTSIHGLAGSLEQPIAVENRQIVEVFGKNGVSTIVGTSGYTLSGSASRIDDTFFGVGYLIRYAYYYDVDYGADFSEITSFTINDITYSAGNLRVYAKGAPFQIFKNGAVITTISPTNSWSYYEIPVSAASVADISFSVPGVYGDDKSTYIGPIQFIPTGFNADIFETFETATGYPFIDRFGATWTSNTSTPLFTTTASTMGFFGSKLLQIRNNGALINEYLEVDLGIPSQKSFTFYCKRGTKTSTNFEVTLNETPVFNTTLWDSWEAYTINLNQGQQNIIRFRLGTYVSGSPTVLIDGVHLY